MINPLILLCGVMYFGIGLIVYKYQFAFVYVKRYEYNGKYWRYVFRYVSDGLLIFQLSMIGVLALKQAFSPSIGLVPLLGGTVAFKVICRSKFRDRMKYIPLERLYERETETEAKETETNIEISVNDGQLFSNMNHGENTTNFSTSPLEKSHSSGQTHDSLASRGPSLDRNQSSINTQSDFFGTNPSPLPNTSYRSNCSNAPNLNINSSPSPERYLNSSGSINSLWLKKSQSTGLIHDRFGKNTAFSNYRDFLPVSKCTKVCGVQSRSSIESSSNQFLSTEDPKTLSSIEGTPIPICHVVEESIKPNNKQRWGKIQQQIINNPLLSLFLHPFTNSSGPVSEDLAEVPPNPGTPCRETYQDDTDPYETYIHPDFIRPLPKSLWLPKNPLKKLHDLDSDTIEVKTVLSSSLLEITSAQTDNDIAHTTVNNKSTFALGYLGQSLPRRVKSNLSTHENARRGHRIRQPSKVDFRYDAIFNTQTNQLELVNRSKASLDPNSNEMESLRLRRDTNGFIDVIRSGLISIGNRSEILLPWTHRKEYEEKEQDILESRSVRSSVSSGLSI
ncbi:hypothetical protein K7432_006622 [Basidiobolus ranarum]|uniref:CSC1/OSCA1-like 7TM region domain-containing protein n=1 Tax=Basidiobolus ranarum TaxID=34480 RepID=A0ABR2WUM2_9FUNG